MRSFDIKFIKEFMISNKKKDRFQRNFHFDNQIYEL